MATIDEFIAYAQGKVFNSQGNVMNINYVQTSYPYGGQCVSLAQGFMKYFACEVRARGNAIDWWRNFNSNGLSAYFTKSGSPVNGALCITNGDPTFGHIGIYYNGRMLQQNYAGNPYARLLPILGTVYGYLIPKFSVSSNYSASQLIKEHGKATFINDIKIIIHRDTPTGSSYGSFVKGEVQEYTEKWVGLGHRWISWIHTNGVRCFAAISGSEIQGKDLWASFSSVQAPTEPSQPSGTINLAQEDGVATFTVDGVRARYDSPTGTVCKTYNTGDSIRYYWKYVGNGHRYVVGKDGDRKVFVAVSATEDRSQMWATFEAPKEDKKEETKPTEPAKPTEQPKPVEKPNLTKNVKGYGVDISEHNGADFDVSKYDFVIIRAAWGENTDKLFETYVQKCVNAKIPYGVYVYDYALDDSQAKAEAEYVLNLIKDKDVQLGVWFDMEDADGYKKKNNVLTKERCTSSCKVFCDILKAHGYYTGVYTSTSWIGTYVDTDYPLWIANWGSNNGTVQSDQSSIAVMHQYSANPIDKDVIFHEFDFFKSNPIKEEVKPTPRPEESKPEVKPEESKPEDKKDETTKEEIANKKVNSLIDLLIKLVKKILRVFS